jgi:hypothetical protein
MSWSSLVQSGPGLRISGYRQFSFFHAGLFNYALAGWLGGCEPVASAATVADLKDGS